MRTSAIIIFMICLSTIGIADSFSAARCFGKIEQKISPGDTVTVFTDDGAGVRGMFPSIVAGGSALYLRTAFDTAGSSRMMIPLVHIDKITYRKRSNICKIFGAGAGFIGGAIMGAALAPEKSSGAFFDDPKIGFGILGAIIGAFIGGAGGAEVDKLLTITLSVKCD